MIGGSAQRDRGFNLHDAYQQQFEPHAVFLGEKPGQSILPAVEIIQLALDAHITGRQFFKGQINLFQLICFRAVFRVIDHGIFASGFDKSVIARLGFGLRLGSRHDHRGEKMGQVHIFYDRNRFHIVFFQQYADIQLVLRIIQILNIAD